ncbi:MAG: hypothetical protein JOZ92_10360 [Candidatus Dormibacteraeota bacterium]|nr:hypothetical protein [Candidatus Dormibacteraeota bacterium]
MNRRGVAVPDPTVVPDRQHLPVPIGGRAPAHRRRARFDIIRRRRVELLRGVTLALIAVAVGLVALPPGDSMYVDAGGMHIDGATLRPGGTLQGGSLYVGDGAVVVGADGADSVAGSALTINGHAVTGRCAGHRDTEHCTFTIDGRRITADDVYDATARRWTRTYSDGTHIAIDVPSGGSPVPVVVPLGVV